MLNLDNNYISCIILDGVYQPELSDKDENLIFSRQTLKIPANTTIEKPIHLLFLTSQNCRFTIDIIAAQNSSSAIIEEYTSLGTRAYKNNIKINIIAENNSKITHYKLQYENNITTHNAHTNIKQKQNSSITSGFIGKGAKAAHDTLHVELAEENASFNTFGIISLNDTQALDYKAHIEHLAPNCTSNVLFKGIINDKAIGNFKCLVVAHSGAAKTQTHVTNKNLLLSELATMNTAPELEIYADDVICTHGATVGQLDKEALFYLRSRGLTENIATQLLTSAFISEIIEQFADYCKHKINLGIAYEY